MSKYSNNMPPSIKDAIGWMYDDIEPGKTLLDVGCATGYFGEYIKQTKNAKVYGIEISDDRFEAEKVLDGVYSFDLDVKEWPKRIYARTYDYIFFGDILEHVKNPTEVLRKARKLLKSEGKVFISTPNIAHISTRLELINGNFEYENMGILDNTHLKYFTLSYLKRIVAEAGYNLNKVDYSTNDYPRAIQQRLLKKAGLIPTDNYWKMTEKKEARAFQYKLILTKTKNGTNAAKTKYEKIPEKPEQFRDTILDERKEQVTLLKKHADEQAKIIEHYQYENQELKQQLAEAKSLTVAVSARLRRLLRRK